jgi:hypothetical protein
MTQPVYRGRAGYSQSFCGATGTGGRTGGGVGSTTVGAWRDVIVWLTRDHMERGARVDRADSRQGLGVGHARQRLGRRVIGIHNDAASSSQTPPRCMSEHIGTPFARRNLIARLTVPTLSPVAAPIAARDVRLLFQPSGIAGWTSAALSATGRRWWPAARPGQAWRTFRPVLHTDHSPVSVTPGDRVSFSRCLGVSFRPFPTPWRVS